MSQEQRRQTLEEMGSLQGRLKGGDGVVNGTSMSQDSHQLLKSEVRPCEDGS